MPLTLPARVANDETRVSGDAPTDVFAPDPGDRNLNQLLLGTGSPHADPVDNSDPLTSATTHLLLADIPAGIEQRLKYLVGLPANWDDQGTAQVLPSTAGRASLFLQEAFTEGRGVLPHPFIDVAFDGRLVLEWETPEGKELIVDLPVSMEDPIPFLLVEVGPDSREKETPGEIGNTWTSQGIIRRLLARRRIA